MGVYINSLEKIKKRLHIDNNGSAQSFMTQTCAKHMDKYVPMRNGQLRQYRLSQNAVHYEQPYASYQYYGKRADGTHIVENYTTPGTGPYWDKRMMSAEKNEVIDEVQRFINNGGK